MSIIEQAAFAPLKALSPVGREKPIVVLKFGSSVLVSRESLPEVVSEIYRVVRSGRRVVAVTSAFLGVTDQLLTDAAAIGCPHDNINAPAFVAIGEETSAALVALACDRSGLCAIALKAPELGLMAQGAQSDAAPVSLRSDVILSALANHDVVVVPGFVGTDEAGRTMLLGRGGSDLTAVFLGHELAAERVRLVKDVDGVYDHDPAQSPSALRYRRIDWDEARAVANELVQPRALDFAAAHNLAIEVGAIATEAATLISRMSAPPTARPARRKLRVALAGCGVVGAGVAQRLLRRPDAFEITGVLVRDLNREREAALPRALFTTEASKLLECGADVIVDVMSCGRAGALLSEAALAAGIDVVSANKQAIVLNYDALERASVASGARLLHSAAVGGGAPLLETVRLALESGADIIAVEAVLNGTVNFVLEELARGASFEQALAGARQAGLAEEDPSADLNGADAAAKLNLIARAAFGCAPVRLTIAGLDHACAERARSARLKQVATLFLNAEGLEGEIRFQPAAHGPFARLSGDRNGIRVTAVDGRVWSAQGRGAGRWPTTESVFADLVDLSIGAAGAGRRSR